MNSGQILLSPLPHQLSGCKQVSHKHWSLGKGLDQSRLALTEALSGRLISDFKTTHIYSVAVRHQSRQGIQTVHGCALNPVDVQPGNEMSRKMGPKLGNLVILSPWRDSLQARALRPPCPWRDPRLKKRPRQVSYLFGKVLMSTFRKLKFRNILT